MRRPSVEQVKSEFTLFEHDLFGKPVSTFPDHAVTLHHILSTRRASSVIRSGVQAGSQTRLTLTTPTPGTLATAFSTICGNSPAAGQFGVVSVITTSTLRSSLMSTL